MRKFYFTFSNDPDMPYEEGYVVVWAANIKEACERFMKAYPPVKPWSTRSDNNVLRCANIYEEDDEFAIFKGPQHEVLGWRD